MLLLVGGSGGDEGNETNFEKKEKLAKCLFTYTHTKKIIKL